LRTLGLAATLVALILGAPVAGAAGATITVTHDLGVARPGAVILVAYDKVAAVAPGLRMFHVVVRDAKGRVLPSQIANYEHDHRGAQYDWLVFTYDFAAGEKRAVFTLEPVANATPPETPCAYARFVPERYDDMAWENDRIAHRMYGPALNTAAAGGERLRGSGIDVWAKRVTYPVIDRWYAKGHDQFHKDEEGEGLDLYSIGGSRGAGGTGIWDGDKLWTSDNFTNASVLVNGPRHAAFVLEYAPWDAGAAGEVSETKAIRVDCGLSFDQVISTFFFKGSEVVAGIGITQHPPAAGYPAAVLTQDPDGRWMSFWEENKDGGLGIAVVLSKDATSVGFAHEAAPGGKGNANNLLLVKVKPGVPVPYYTGAGWTKGGQFADRASWEKYVRETAVRMQHPLRVTVSSKP
jgi:hypothetical protein